MDQSLSLSILFPAGSFFLILFYIIWNIFRPKASSNITRDQYDELKLERDENRKQIDALESERGELKAQLARISATRDAELKAHADKLKTIKAAQEELKSQFKLTANEVLKESGETLRSRSAEKLEVLLKPLKEQIDGFQQKVIDDAEKRARQTGALHQLVDTLHSDTLKISEEANNLTNALRSQSRIQGEWGETILETILQSAGLEKGVNYSSQTTIKSDEGKNKRPDFIVYLPDNQSVIVDSKVSIRAFERYIAASTEEEKNDALGQHVKAIKNHIDALSSKDYAKDVEGYNYTFMFIPLEDAYISALQHDRSLIQYAADKKIAIVSQTTLMMSMKIIDQLWNVEKRNQGVEKITIAAESLYNKFVSFLDSYSKVGRALDTASTAFHKSTGQLSEGRGNIVKKVDELRSMGIEPSKPIPEGFKKALNYDDGADETPQIEDGREAD